MRPKQHEMTGSGDLFRARLDQIINMKHELVQLAGRIDWTWIDTEIAPLYSEKGRPGIATRFVIGLFLLGAAWGLGLAVLGWVLNPYAPQREAVASVYQSIAQALRAVGTADFEPRRQAVTDAMNTAYDQVITARDLESRLAALLLRADGVIEATLTLAREPTCPDAELIEVTERIAEVIVRPSTGAAPWILSVSDSSRTPGLLALAQALVCTTDALAGDTAVEPGVDPRL